MHQLNRPLTYTADKMFTGDKKEVTVYYMATNQETEGPVIAQSLNC